MKRWLTLFIAILSVLTLSACQYTAVSDKDSGEPVIAFVAGMGTVEDGSFNSGIAEGLKKGASEFGYDLKILESTDSETHQSNLSRALELKPAMIVADYTLTDAVLKAASENLSVHYVLVDSVIDKKDTVPENVLAVDFDNAEGAFLMGVVGASASKSNTVGFIGGSAEGTVKEAEIGFKAGVKAVNPTGKVVTENIDTFFDEDKAYKAADKLHGQGADVLFSFAGGANYGVLKHAAEKQYWCIGSDRDQALIYPQMASRILCSMVKNLDNILYNIVKTEAEGQFKGGIEQCGIANGGIVAGGGGGNLTGELQDVYNKWRKAIADGKVKVPKTEDALKNFKAPEIG